MTPSDRAWTLLLPLRLPAGALLVALAAAACGGNGTPSTPGPGPDPDPDPDPDPPTSPVPAYGEPSTLDFGTWNVEWFGDPGNGPDDEALQLQNAVHVLRGAEVDVWGLQEIVDEDHFAALVDSLDGYQGLLANDPTVSGGPAFYNGFGGNEQKVALVWRSSLATLRDARVILTDFDHEFAGRPPVEYRLSVTLGGATEDLVVIVLHAKAGAGADDRDRREAGSEALKSYVDATWPDEEVLVIGDFNDDVDVSITSGRPSPYRNFVDDADSFLFPTKSLSDAGVSASVYYPDIIDHHLATDEMADLYVAGSAAVVEAGAYLTDYGDTTSDHYPVVTRYRPGG